MCSPKKSTHQAGQIRQSAGAEYVWAEPGENSFRLKVTVRRITPAVFEFDNEACVLSEACCHGAPSSWCVHIPPEGAGCPHPLIEGEEGLWLVGDCQRRHGNKSTALDSDTPPSVIWWNWESTLEGNLFLRTDSLLCICLCCWHWTVGLFRSLLLFLGSEFQ